MTRCRRNLRLMHLLGGVAPVSLALATCAAAQTPLDGTPAAAAGATPIAASPQPGSTSGQSPGAPDIVVTGSRITRPDLVASSPVATLSAEALKANNAVTVEELLNANPQFVPGSNAASNNPSDGVGTVDLRGLGVQRTLVLIDGKRAPSYDTKGEVDVNTIPTALIKRVDVLTGGASAVYGSDAIAGVVNFILDDRFTGLRADVSSEVSSRGDGAQYDASLTGGIKLGDRGNLVVSGGYSKRDGLKYSARPRNSNAIDSTDLVSSAGSSNADPTVFDLPKRQVQVNDAGNLVPIYDLYNFTPVNYVQTPLERYDVMALARYQLTDGVEFFGRANYTHVKVNAINAPTATAGFPFDISPDNPNLTPGERSVFFGPELKLNPDGTSTIGIRRRITESPGRIQNFVSRNYQAVGGLRGEFDGGYRWEVFGQYGETRRHQDLLNDLSFSALTQAIDAVQGPNGPVCRNPAGGCVPINVFSTGTIPAGQLAFVLADGAVDSKTTELVTGGDISGDLGFLRSPLADQPAAVSAGVEYRRETGSSVANPKYASGDLVFYGQGQTISGRYDTKEAYFELKMPLIQDRPFFSSLNLEGGFRYSKYSTVGSVYTYKGGGDYSPVEGVRFRGIYQRAVRAPNIFELFSPIVSGTGSLANDPCAGSNVPAAIAPICTAQGAPSVGSITQPVSGQINVFAGGNPNLKAEKSDTYTVGVVVNPPAIRSLALSLDYYSIAIAGAIDPTPPQVTIDQCFNVDRTATSAACQSIRRSHLNGGLSGDLSIGVPEVLGNVARKTTNGVDVALSYHGGNPDAFTYALSFAGTYVINFKQQSSATAAAVQCAGRFGGACNIEPIPHWKHTAGVDLGYGGVTLLTRWRYLGAVREDVGTDILKRSIPNFNYFDETMSVDVDQRFTFRLGVQNLFDKKSPIVGDTVGNDFNAGSTFPVIYDVIGRTFFAGVSAKF